MGPVRVVIAVNQDAEVRLAERIEGQTTDLDVFIIVAQVGPDLDRKRVAAAARAEAKARNAQVAVWFLSEGDGWVVHVSHGERTFRRLVSESRGALSSSASIEAVALVVRTALMGLAAGEEVPESPPQAEPASEPPFHLLFELAWTAVLDRSGGTGHHGAEARFGVGFGAWSFTFGLEEHPPDTLSADQATILLERQVGALSVGYGIAPGPRWRLGAALGPELLRFSRVTTTVTDDLLATPPQSSWSFAVRPELEVRFLVVRAAVWSLWAFFRVGADVLFVPPAFAVATLDTTQILSELWWIQPRASLGLAIELE